jgi:hypothetical protein
VKGHHGHRQKHARAAKHAGSAKHRPMSAAQAAAWKKFQQAGSHANHVHAVARHAQPAKPAKWSPNADVACCAAEALAASLRLTGRSVSGEDVLELYWRTASHEDAGAGLLATIEAAAEHGLAGVRLLDARPATALGTGVVLGVDLAERHALTVDGHGVWTWGGWRPAPCGLLTAADEAWEVTWPRP